MKRRFNADPASPTSAQPILDNTKSIRLMFGQRRRRWANIKIT